MQPVNKHVNLETDFPNYFAYLEKQDAKDFLQHALASLLERIEVPYFDREKDIFTTRDFFTKLNETAQKLAPGSKLYVSGGVVRSMIGYVYKKLYTSHQRHLYKNKTISHEQMVGLVRETLNDIIKGKSWKHSEIENKAVIALRVLGMNSDLDVLIEYPKEFKKNSSVESEITDFINSAESHLGLFNDKGELKKSIIPVGDVKEYNKQLGEGSSSAVKQGGSTLDWLAFPINSQGKPSMRCPEKYPQILDDLLEGKLSYVQASSLTRDLDKQAIRGLRPLLELPFACLDQESSATLQKELMPVVLKTEASKSISPGALEQLEKMVRNARFEGAHNRFVILSSKAPDQIINSLASRLSLALKSSKLFFIPEFLKDNSIECRTEDKGNLFADKKLLSPDFFFKDHTDNGILYHGTPHMENVLYMMRNGLVVSNDRQGTAAFGRGTYTTDKMELAQDYASAYGIVIPLTVNLSRHLRILDLGSAEGKKLLDDVKNEFSASDPHEILEKHFDIDIIIAENGYVLLQNLNVIKIQKNVQTLIRASIEHRNSKKLHNKALTYESAKELFDFEEANFNHGYDKIISYLDPEFKSNLTINFLHQLLSSDPSKQMLLKLLANQKLSPLVMKINNWDDAMVEKIAMEEWAIHTPGDHHHTKQIIELLKNLVKKNKAFESAEKVAADLVKDRDKYRFELLNELVIKGKAFNVAIEYVAGLNLIFKKKHAENGLIICREILRQGYGYDECIQFAKLFSQNSIEMDSILMREICLLYNEFFSIDRQIEEIDSTTPNRDLIFEFLQTLVNFPLPNDKLVNILLILHFSKIFMKLKNWDMAMVEKIALEGCKYGRLKNRFTARRLMAKIVKDGYGYESAEMILTNILDYTLCPLFIELLEKGRVLNLGIKLIQRETKGVGAIGHATIADISKILLSHGQGADAILRYVESLLDTSYGYQHLISTRALEIYNETLVKNQTFDFAGDYALKSIAKPGNFSHFTALQLIIVAVKNGGCYLEALQVAESAITNKQQQRLSQSAEMLSPICKEEIFILVLELYKELLLKNDAKVDESIVKMIVKILSTSPTPGDTHSYNMGLNLCLQFIAQRGGDPSFEKVLPKVFSEDCPHELILEIFDKLFAQGTGVSSAIQAAVSGIQSTKIEAQESALKLYSSLFKLGVSFERIAKDSSLEKDFSIYLHQELLSRGDELCKTKAKEFLT